MIYMFLAEGFEEIEALGTLDILRRAGLEVRTVSISEPSLIGAHGISVAADMTLSEIREQDCSGVILPGGLPGTTNLENNETVKRYIKLAAEKNILLAAICAAPSILGHMGILAGKRATAYPGYESELEGATVTLASAERDGLIITGRGAGAVFDFGLKIVEALKGGELSSKLKETMQCNA